MYTGILKHLTYCESHVYLLNVGCDEVARERYQEFTQLQGGSKAQYQCPKCRLDDAKNNSY